jgi:hypothetical protein
MNLSSLPYVLHIPPITLSFYRPIIVITGFLSPGTSPVELVMHPSTQASYCYYYCVILFLPGHCAPHGVAFNLFEDFDIFAVEYSKK